MGAAASFGHFNDSGHIVGVAIDRDAAFDDFKGKVFGFEVAVVDADEGGELGAGGMAHDENAVGIAAVFGDVVVDPAEGLGDVLKDGGHLDIWQEAVAGGNKDESFVHEDLWLGLNTGAVAGLPSAAVNPEDDGEIFGGFRSVNVEFLAWVPGGGVGDVAVDFCFAIG
jgi:hypothetical protein